MHSFCMTGVFTRLAGYTAEKMKPKNMLARQMSVAMFFVFLQANETHEIFRTGNNLSESMKNICLSFNSQTQLI